MMIITMMITITKTIPINGIRLFSHFRNMVIHSWRIKTMNQNIKITIEPTIWEGTKEEKLEEVLGVFEDFLSEHFDIDPMVNSLDIVDAVALD